MRTVVVMLVLLAGQSWAVGPWNIRELQRAPHVQKVAAEEPGVEALYFESVPFHGKPTRVFAYYGSPGGRNLPAMVLVHGGGGTAFAEWVRMWNRRGYAAISIDTCGNVPSKAEEAKRWDPARKRHEHAGPVCDGGFAHVDEPVTDQWSYHAVAAVVGAHSVLRTMPGVDAKRIGITGISWGGYLTNIAAGLDGRFRFAAPVYGCGFLGEDSTWLKEFEKMGPERAKKWLHLWDPSRYLPGAKMPMLWVTGTNDFAYPFSSLQKSYRLPKGQRTLAIRVRMPHNHPDGAKPEEIFAFADAMSRGAAALPKIVRQRPEMAEFRSKRPVVKAELNYTTDGGAWQKRNWKSVEVQVDQKARRAQGVVPAAATAWYLNLFDDRGLVVSTEHGVAR